MWGVQKKRQKKGKTHPFFHTLWGHLIFFITSFFLSFAYHSSSRTHTHTKRETRSIWQHRNCRRRRQKKTPQPRKRYEKKAVVVVRATFWEHRSAWIRDVGFRARVILESPRRGSFRFVAFRLVFLPRARGQMMFFEKGCILGLRKRGGGGSMSSFPGRDSADANVGRKVRAFTRAH